MADQVRVADRVRQAGLRHVQQRVYLLDQLLAHGSVGDRARYRVELDSQGARIRSVVSVDAGLAVQHQVEHIGPRREDLRVHRRAVVDDELGLLS